MPIRPMKSDDYNGVYRLWIRTPGMGLNAQDDSYDGISAFLARNPNTCFVSDESGEINGSILAGHDGRRGYIYHAAVSAESRGRGIGTALAERAISALEREGICKAALVVFARNETGNDFWERRGFIRRDDLVYRNKNITQLTRIDT
jgi:N-acetylglutamate synthase